MLYAYQMSVTIVYSEYHQQWLCEAILADDSGSHHNVVAQKAAHQRHHMWYHL